MTIKAFFDAISNKPQDWKHDYTALQSCLTGGAVLDWHFANAGSGSFKDVYYFNHLHDYVVKFISEDNGTAAEREILNAAAAAELEEIFLDSWYYVLPRAVDVVFSEDFTAACEQDTKCAAIQIQRKADATGLDFPTRREPLKTKNPIIHELRRYIPNQCWLEDFENFYDEEFQKDFLRFLEKYEITDLHDGNIGWIDERPIILDWLSLSSAEKKM